LSYYSRVKVAARITWVAGFVSASAVFVYAAVEQRAENLATIESQRDQARAIAAVLRTALEVRQDGLNIEQLQRMSRESSRDITGWSVAIVPGSALERTTPSSPAVKRLRALEAARAGHIWSEDDGMLVYTLPLLVADAASMQGTRLIGSIEVAKLRPVELGSWTASFDRLLIPCALIVLLIAIAVRVQTRRVVSHPIEKLLVGMDDVTKGDLSHALLAEREDEIGLLASHFNDMTRSLRESKAETQKQTSARATAERKLQTAEKMATIGQLAAEIAHEVGTPLHVIAGRARTMSRKAGDPALVQRNADIIFEQSSRITRIIQRLLDFSRKRATEQPQEALPIGDVLRTTLEFLDTRLQAAQITPTLDIADDTPAVEGYPDQLQQVFINLIVNASEAMPKGGPLEIKAFGASGRRPGLENAPAQYCAMIEVSDSGAGIPEGERERVFEPFYTTKERAGGTGLGLAVSSSIIKDHDGWLEVDQSSLGGARFRVCLPIESA